MEFTLISRVKMIDKFRNQKSKKQPLDNSIIEHGLSKQYSLETKMKQKYEKLHCIVVLAELTFCIMLLPLLLVLC